MIVHHNIPFTLADELTPLFCDIFPNSDIAKNFASRRTKTTCIVNGDIAPSYQQALVEYMREKPFFIAIDGSSDSGLEKMNPLTVCILNKSGFVHTELLDMCMSSDSTAEGIFSEMQHAFMKHLIHWINCIGRSVDNTSVNIGIRNSIKTCVLAVNLSVYVMGCPCHIVHNIAGKGSSTFEEVSGFSVDDFVIDIYYWFDKSTKRKATMAEYCTFCDVTYRDIIKH
uniref:DUF659 domain-containing protein n=1 Tax=Amphimedon queenslandica TaxID=400682 RepID=A0A1X7TM57_AMPQE